MYRNSKKQFCSDRDVLYGGAMPFATGTIKQLPTKIYERKDIPGRNNMHSDDDMSDTLIF